MPAIVLICSTIFAELEELLEEELLDDELLEEEELLEDELLELLDEEELEEPPPFPGFVGFDMASACCTINVMIVDSIKNLTLISPSLVCEQVTKRSSEEREKIFTKN